MQIRLQGMGTRRDHLAFFKSLVITGFSQDMVTWASCHTLLFA